ncbi:hypothetical protein ACQBAU_08800 [Propionibacteriaceae bacterium Y2011]|uniref:hypothetical protein n=1 Tax=Microlunatus sp. Y2014 TaxID=3418488 RepID=UPI003B44AF3C
MKIFTDPDLHGTTPLRVQPGVGEWGPDEVVTTRTKRRLRRFVPILFVLSLIALVVLGWWFYGFVTTPVE